MDLEKYALEKLSKIASHTVVKKINSTSKQVKFVNNKISHITIWHTEDIHLLASFNKRIVGTDLHELNEAGVDDAIKKLAAISKNIPQNPDFLDIAKGPFKYKKVDCYDEKIENCDEEIVSYTSAGIDEAINHGAKKCSGILDFGTAKIRVLTSNNVDAEYKTTNAYYSIRAQYDKEASGHMVSCSTDLKNLDYLESSREAARIALLSKNPQNIESGKYDILFSPLSFANMIDHYGMASSIFSVESGLSCLEGKEGQKIGSDEFTLYDSGDIEKGLATSPFDDEGHPTEKTTIIEEGVLKNYLHNTSTGLRYNKKSTGNAGIIEPRPTNLIVKNGKRTAESILNELDGIWITNVWYTRFQNYRKGDFSTIPRDGCFLVKDRKIIPLKGLRLNANLLDIAKNLDQVTKETKQIHGWEVSTPVFTGHGLVKDLNITTTY